MTEHYELTNVPCQGEKCAVAPKVGFGEPIRIPPRPFSVIAGLISTAASLVGTQDRWLSEPRLPRGRAIRASTPRKRSWRRCSRARSGRRSAIRGAHSGALDRPEPSDPAARAPIRTSAPYSAADASGSSCAAGARLR